jgi:DNA-binding IclR family transcriptional regulator
MQEDRDDIDERYLVPGLVRGLEILRAFSKDRQQMTVAEIARKIDISRSTVFRLVYTLEVTDFLRKIPNSKKYELSSGVIDLGYALLSDQDLVETANPILRMLRDETQTSTHLAVRNGREAIYIARFAGSTSLISTIGVGSRFPAHATVAGRVLLTGLTLPEITRLFNGADLPAYSPQTPTSIGAVITQVEADRHEASLLSWGYYEPDVAAIAAAVYGASGEIEAAISISCPLKTHDRAAFGDTIRRRVEVAARELSRARGYRPASSVKANSRTRASKAAG